MDLNDSNDLFDSTIRRPSRSATHVLGGVIIGLLIAIVVIPDHEDSTPSGVAALAEAAGSTAASSGGTVASGPSSAVTGDTTTPVAPGDGAGATAGSPSGGTVSRGAAPTTAAPAARGGTDAKAAAVDNTKLPNGGATARGVTATEIKIGFGSIDPSVLAPICPACDPGQAKDGAPAEALIRAWTRDGLLPVNGRTIKPFNRIIGLTADQQRSACTYFAQEVKPFLVVAGAGTGGTGVCAASEYKIPVVDAYGGYKDTTLKQNYPLIHIVAPSASRILRNLVSWAEENGMLRGQTIGMYSYDDAVNANAAFGVENIVDQASLTKDFRQLLAQKGYKLAVDFVANQGQEAAGVLRMKTANVTSAFVFSGMADFQQQSREQGFRPKFPVADLGYSLGEAVASSGFDPETMNGQIAMAVRQEPKSWAARKPATPDGTNKTFSYCLKAYTDFTKRTLDTFSNGSELSLMADICAALEVVRAALQAAGPNLTVERFIAGIQTIKNMETSEYPSVSFGPGRYAGSDSIATFKYNKDRWQPSNDLFRIVTPWRPMYVP